MATQISLNSIGKDMDWTWPRIVSISDLTSFQTTFQNQDWSDIRTAYQNFDESITGYWVYDEMHPNGICMYEKLPKVSTSNDPENSVWVPLAYIGIVNDMMTTISDGCVRIGYYLVHTTNPLREASSSSLSFGDGITVYIVDGVFDHAELFSTSDVIHPVS